MIRSRPQRIAPAATAAYIEQAAAELRDLAIEAKHPFLGYLIDMVRLEAASEAVKGLRVVPRDPIA
jgi:hypothetical protein